MSSLQPARGPAWPYAALVAVPAAVFVLPQALGGHLLLTGDNLIQNYPLRVLVGSMLASRHLPLWDPYLWSGTPLLAGFNAGALYPLNGLFAVVAPHIAWVVTETAVYGLIATGTYAFLRGLGVSVVAALLGASVFAFSGAVASQVLHLDMTEGFASLPWMLLATRKIVVHGHWRWCVLLGVGFALVILGGAPEAMLDEAALLGVYGILTAGVDGVRWARLCSRGALGAAIALGIGAIQWLPGLDLIAHSQRAGAGWAFFTAGPLPPTAGLLAVVPYLLGGYGRHDLYFGTYSLPEVSTYLGILPLVGAIALAGPAWSARLPGGERRTWYTVLAVSILLALGVHTPVEHVLFHVPLYGQQRLQSRNIVGADLAVCVLFAWWLDGGDSRRVRASRRWETFAPVLPLATAVALGAWLLVDARSLLLDLGSRLPPPRGLALSRRDTAVAIAFCLGAIGVTWSRPRLTPRGWLALAGVFAVVDVGVWSSTSQLAFPAQARIVDGSTQLDGLTEAALAHGGRYAVYDPQLYDYSTLLTAFDPDLNILARLHSAGGYGSVVSASYDAATSTHDQADLDPAALARGVFAQLDLQVVDTVAESFISPLTAPPSAGGTYHVASSPAGHDPALPGGNLPGPGLPAAFRPPPRRALPPGGQEGWYLGATLRARAATVLLEAPAAGQRLRAGTLRA
ncbi:MAG: hypothetical protein ACRDZQ_05740, partial [Acidimicrobiales bacterium]